MPNGCPNQDECPPDLWEVLGKIFQPEPRRRVTCDGLLKLMWLQPPTSAKLHTQRGVFCYALSPLMWTPCRITTGAYLPSQLNTLTTRAGCIGALTRNVGDSTAWFSLGITLGGDEVADVGGEAITQQSCYIRSLAIDPKNTIAWTNLGISMEEDEEVIVNGTPYSKQDCFIRALDIIPRNSHAWSSLGGRIPPGGGGSQSKRPHVRRDPVLFSRRGELHDVE